MIFHGLVIGFEATEEIDEVVDILRRLEATGLRHAA